LAVCQADWFQDNAGITCTGVRKRKAWSKATPEERCRYVRLVHRMKSKMNEWRTGYGQESLYDTFVMIHGGGANYGWHYTSIFPYAHKAFCWMYESALFYVGCTEGESMIPPIYEKKEEMCDFALLYWDWETTYDSRATKVAPYPILESSIWDPTLLGSTNVEPGTNAVIDGLFATNLLTNNWVLYKDICSVAATTTTPASGCDKRLKRVLNPLNAPGLDPKQIMQTLYSKPNYIDFCPWICAQGHSGIHGFIGMSMAATMQSPDDCFFWLHHTNVDRFLHLWLGCNRHDLTLPSDISPTQFCHLNPTVSSQQPAKDKDKNIIQYTPDTIITFYLSSGRAAKYLPESKFPSSRQLWRCGSETEPGWNGMAYTYHDDDLVKNIALNSVCPNAEWKYFSFSQKRSEETPSDPYVANLYQNITDEFYYLTEEKGMTPQEAVDKMAWDACMANPTVITDETKTFLKGVGLTPMDTKRICDDPEKLKLSEEEMANWHSGHHHH
jgi:hypothetical protein